MGKLHRKSVQIITFIITNGYIKGFFSGSIYKGKLKNICVPGLNCYSCPGALGACPIGSLQAVICDMKYNFSFYIVGFLMFIGVTMGRFICGWLCPFGLFQELLNKIPSPKFTMGKKFQKLKYLKYLILIIFVILLPMFYVNDMKIGIPTFCKYICTAGTLQAGIPLTILNTSLRSTLGFLFAWKLTLFIITIILSIITFRPFCKFICPLGAVYSLFNPISIYKLKLNNEKCIACGACTKICPMDIEVYKNPNNLECIRCGDCVKACSQNALKVSIKN